MNDAQATQTPSSSARGSILPALIGAALLGIVAVLLGDFFQLPAALQAAISNPNAELDRDELARWDTFLLYSNLSLLAAIAGAITCGTLGYVSGKGAKWAVVGCVLGIVLGIVGSFLGRVRLGISC